VRAAHGSYFVTMYKRGRHTWSKRSMKREKEEIKKRKKEQEKERKRKSIIDSTLSKIYLEQMKKSCQ